MGWMEFKKGFTWMDFNVHNPSIYELQVRYVVCAVKASQILGLI